jgi:hypothetical protein
MMPFISQLHAIAERKLTCANMCRRSLHAIPTIIYSACSENNSPFEENICVVCLDSYNDGQTLRVLPCGHPFHKDCIDAWLLGYKSDVDAITSCCPMCKRNSSQTPLAENGVKKDDKSSLSSPTLTPQFHIEMDIPDDIFTSMGSILNGENAEAYIPCATLEASEYSDCGFPITINHVSSVNDSITLPSVLEEQLQ